MMHPKTRSFENTMTDRSPDPSPTPADTGANGTNGINGNGSNGNGPRRRGLVGWVLDLFGPVDRDTAARDALVDMIVQKDDARESLDNGEHQILTNVLTLNKRTIEDVMVPRVDIRSIEAHAALDHVIDVMTREGHSRLPVYRETLDDAIGMIHIRDVLAWRGQDKKFSPEAIVRKVLFVAPSMQVLELLLEMRIKRCHMALVVDEYGGVDGLVTIEDLVEEIVGEIEDEHDRITGHDLVPRPDGAFEASARTEIEALEDQFGPILSDDEREDIDTLGGLVFSLTGRVPIRGELVAHPSGLEFEVLDADPRRIKRLRVRRTAQRTAED